MIDAQRAEEGPAPQPRPDPSESMLRDVLACDTYDVAASRHGTTRTGVEHRIKVLAAPIAASVEIARPNEDGVAFVRRLQAHREAVLLALETLEAEECRVRVRSPHALGDLALYYSLLVTGARPLDTGRARPLYFRSSRPIAAIDEYPASRLKAHGGSGAVDRYRGLDPLSELFLSPAGRGFEILGHGAEGQRRFRCRSLQETYRKIWRYADFKHFTILAARHTVADRQYARGADELQAGRLLGISERGPVREVFPRRLPTLDYHASDLV